MNTQVQRLLNLFSLRTTQCSYDVIKTRNQTWKGTKRSGVELVLQADESPGNTERVMSFAMNMVLTVLLNETG